MATGIRKRHTADCASRQGGRCRCKGAWEAWVYLRREGRKVHKSFQGEAEAKSWRADGIKAAKSGALRRPTTLTIEQAAWLWLEAADAGVVRTRSGEPYKPSTLRGYRTALQLRVLPEFGAHRLSELRQDDVQQFIDELLGEKFKPGSVRNSINPLQALFRHAVRRKLVGVNPTTAIELPKPRGRRERIASATEAAALLEALAKDRALWATAFYAGLRRGELRALRWSDVDLGRSEIRVAGSWDEVEGPIDPKSATSARTVPILAVLRDYLVEHKLETGREGEQLVFGRSADQAFIASTVRSRALAAWKAANEEEAKRAEQEGREPAPLASITLHECRHTFASLLIDANVNAKALSTFMGHSTIEMTYNQYGHLMPGSRDQARELVDRYLEAAVAEARLEAAAADQVTNGDSKSAPAPVMPQSDPPDERFTAVQATEAERPETA